jgi:plasmid stabilization system protein ParE
VARQFHILPEAEQDAAEAYRWYEERQPGLGEEFLGCVEVCVQSIRRNPELYSIAHESYRRALVRRFPYAVFYEYAEDTITIYAIFHCSQDPGKWRVRLP